MLTRRGLILHPEEFNERWLDEFANAGLNVLGLHPVGGRRADETLEDAIRRHADPRFRASLEKARNMGITPEYEAHALRWLLPRTMFALHQDWFRMDENGERVADYHMCPSSPDGIRYIENRAELLARALDTGAHRYFFWQDDVHGTLCHCDACKELSPSDQALLIVNAVARGIKRFDPLAKVAYLAYQDTLEVPTAVKPEGGVFLEFAPIWREHHTPICDSSCEKNQKEIRHLQKLLDFFGREDAQVLEYWMDNSMFSDWKKPPKPFTLDAAVMASDVAYYESMGFSSVTSFGCYLGQDYRELYGNPPIERYGAILGGRSL